MTVDELIRALEQDGCELGLPAHVRHTAGQAAMTIIRLDAQLQACGQELRQVRHDLNNALQRIVFLEETRRG